MPMPSLVVIKDTGSASISDARTILSKRPEVKVRFIVAADSTPLHRDNVASLLASAAPQSRWSIVTTEDAP